MAVCQLDYQRYFGENATVTNTVKYLGFFHLSNIKLQVLFIEGEVT